MSKFKVGDKVRRKDQYIDKNRIALSGQVVTVHDINGKCVEIKEDGHEWFADCFELVEPAQESDIVFITTKEYESLKNRIAELEKRLEAKDGWISWNGGECPVDPNILVDVEFADGDIVTGEPADYRNWHHTGHGADIIAYKIVKE